MLRDKGQGEYVFDANEFRYGGGAFGRVEHPSRAAQRLHRRPADAPAGRPARRGGPRPEPGLDVRAGPPLAERPEGGSIKVPYPHNTVSYAYDRESNTYPRGVTGAKRQIDAADGRAGRPQERRDHARQVHPDRRQQDRLEGDIIGSGKAEMYTNGVVIKGTWKKDGDTDPTRFFDADGQPMVFTAGQTFIQVVPDEPRRDGQGGHARPVGRCDAPLSGGGGARRAGRWRPRRPARRASRAGP